MQEDVVILWWRGEKSPKHTFLALWGVRGEYLKTLP